MLLLTLMRTRRARKRERERLLVACNHQCVADLALLLSPNSELQKSPNDALSFEHRAD